MLHFPLIQSVFPEKSNAKQENEEPEERHRPNKRLSEGERTNTKKTHIKEKNGE